MSDRMLCGSETSGRLFLPPEMARRADRVSISHRSEAQDPSNISSDLIRPARMFLLHIWDAMPDFRAKLTSPFLELPIEIRLLIFEYLLLDSDCSTLSIRTEHSLLYNLRKSEQRRRTRYLHMADRFRASTMGKPLQSTFLLFGEMVTLIRD